jgi:hypothetical protein
MNLDGQAVEQLPAWLNRRAFLQAGGLNVGAMALSMLLQGEGRGAAISARVDPLAPRDPHFAPLAKRVIYLHMIGAPSQLDLFEEKPELAKRDGEACPEELTKGKRFAFIGGELTLAGSQFKFARHGRCGHTISELLPNLGGVADDISFIRTLHTNEINHAPAQMFLRSGFGRGGRPGFGSWVAYGLGAETRDLPAYVVLLSGSQGGAGTSLWSSGFLPSVYQGIQLRNGGDPVLFLSNPKGHTTDDRRRLLDTIQELNRERLDTVGDPEIATRVSQYEMAFRMQSSVPELMEIAGETKETLELYGAEPGKASFANSCLLARRLIERGVRVVELYDSDWDHHSDLLTRLKNKCRDTDRGMAALITDLKRRGLLDDTLVVWGSEFGRTPLRQGISGTGTATKPGRDHHKDAYTVWLAGGGIKPGLSYGRTDDFGFNVTENPVHVHDLNATVLHLLGLDHEKLTYRYQGRDFRLTDVHGEVVRGILS